MFGKRGIGVTTSLLLDLGCCISCQFTATTIKLKLRMTHFEIAYMSKMSSCRLKILLPLQLLSLASSLVGGQQFFKTEDGTELSLGVPETLSKKCQ